MGAISNLDTIINTATGGGAVGPDTQHILKVGRVAGAAAVAPAIGRPQSLWQYSGNGMAAGATPGATARNPTRATAGALPMVNPTGGREKWLLGWGAFPNAAGSLHLYDRLADISSLNGTTTGAQTITGLSVTRFTGTNAIGNFIAIEIYTQIGASSTTITASYTNEAGTAGRTTVAVAIGNTNLREVGRFIILPLQAGDLGVRSVESVTLAATTGTAGDFGVTIFHPFDSMAISYAGAGAIRNYIFQPPGPIKLPTDAALTYYWIGQAATVPDNFISWLAMIEA